MSPRTAVPAKEAEALKAALKEMIAELRYKKIIKNSSELAKVLGFKRNTVSGYLTTVGPTPSVPFIEAIKRKYGYDLRTYRKGATSLRVNSRPELIEANAVDTIAIKSTLYILRLKVIDLISTTTKRPASEVTRDLDKAILEQSVIFFDQFGKQ